MYYTDVISCTSLFLCIYVHSFTGYLTYLYIYVRFCCEDFLWKNFLATYLLKIIVTNIYIPPCRPGPIGPHSETGEANDGDWLHYLFSAMLELGVYPRSTLQGTPKLFLAPVDYVAKGVAAVSLRGNTAKGVSGIHVYMYVRKYSGLHL